MKFVNLVKKLHELGINYLGVCCGATPMHIREVAEAAGLRQSQQVNIEKKWKIILCMEPMKELQSICKNMAIKRNNKI